MKFTTLLTVIFVILKLTGAVSWSWWWVFSPTLISLAFTLALHILGVVISILIRSFLLIAALLSRRENMHDHQVRNVRRLISERKSDHAHSNLDSHRRMMSKIHAHKYR